MMDVTSDACNLDNIIENVRTGIQCIQWGLYVFSRTPPNESYSLPALGNSSVELLWEIDPYPLTQLPHPKTYPLFCR